MNITIEIKAPEIAKAIEKLAFALSGKSLIEQFNVREEARATEKVESEGPEPEKAQKEESAAKGENSPKKDEKKEKQSIKLETVRATLAKLSQSGKQAQVKKLIKEIGQANKLTEIDPSHYEALLEAAEEIA
ncbi:MAG: hypothetical protein K0Q73_5957 [Paenibacillus sp.]|nr:hypothetical protein [Paenibacillus sp.]